MEAPRHEAGFRVIFGPQNDALQMGYGAGNIDRRGKFPSKIKLENALSSARYTVRKIKYARNYFNKMHATQAPPVLMLSASHSGAEPD